ncbi:PHP domain-containing protein [Candidatus Woesearchaeota archaeon]|nr:PHP domain-containing protein [Candidatus Woesearchaeota archaeon]
MFKADLHLHTNDDYEHRGLHYSTYNLIDHMSDLGYSVLALTFHNQLYYTKELALYAKKKGILLIPGVEMRIERKHVLVYNAKPAELANVRTFSDFKKIKRNDTLIIAAHPYFFPSGAGKKLEKYADCFDGVEYCHFYTSFLNKNKKGVKTARKYNHAVVGNSDCHSLFQIGHTYTLVDSNNDIASVLQSIKQKRHQLVTKPLSLKLFLKILYFNVRWMPSASKRKVRTFHDRTDGSV